MRVKVEVEAAAPFVSATIVTDFASATGFELVGVGIVVGGFVASLVNGVRLWPTQNAAGAYVAIRSTFGRSILLGLEVLVAGDIIRTVALQPTLVNLAVLALQRLELPGPSQQKLTFT